MMLGKRKANSLLDCRNTALSLLLLFLVVHGGGTCGPGMLGKERAKRKEQRLEVREKYPARTPELSMTASGPPLGAIARGSPEYKALTPEYSPNIIFEEDGETNDNKRMTARCAEKVRNLVSAVRRQWDGQVQIKVMRAYVGTKGRSRMLVLHYEGRAIDFGPSDLDERKYPILGQLAINAGFDWVVHKKTKTQHYIHASVKATGPDNKDWEPDRPGCFHSDSSVRLQNGKEVLMKDLKIGDRVASLDFEGKIIYNPVIMFFHRNPNLTSNFWIITTQDHDKRLLITPTHLIYKVNQQTQQGSAVFANQLAVGDYIYVRNSSSPDSVGVRRITSISASGLTGVFAPLTETGNILVDDIVVSCYAVFPSETISHWTLFPVRILSRLFPNFFNTEDEIPLYPRMLFQLYTSIRRWLEKLE